MHSYLSYSSTNGYRIRRVVKLWVHSMENSASPNTTNGGNQNRRAIIIFNSTCVKAQDWVLDHIAKEYRPCRWTLQWNQAGGSRVPKKYHRCENYGWRLCQKANLPTTDSVVPLG